MDDDATNRLLTEFTPTAGVLVEWTAIGSGVGLLSAFLFALVYATVTGAGAGSFEVGSITVGSALLAGAFVVGSLVVVVVVHEAIHAVVVLAFGGDVSFGVGVAQFVAPYAYVTTSKRLTRNQFVLVALAPLVVITAVGLPLMIAVESMLLVFPLAVNAMGAIGDLWMAGLLLRYPSHVVVEDTRDGIRIYGTESDEPLEPTRARVFLRRAVVGTVFGFVAIFFVLLAAPLGLAILGIPELAIGVPDTPWSVFSFERTPDGGFTSGLNPVGVLAISLLVGIAVSIGWTALGPYLPKVPKLGT